MAMAVRDPTELEEGWKRMREGVDKLIGILEKESDEQFTAEEYMRLYTNIYNMCTQKHPHEYSEQLYKRYKEVFDLYIVDRVLPKLKETALGEQLLREVLLRWENHRVMVKWLRNFFDYLDRYHVVRHNLPSLNDVGLLTFRDTVFKANKDRTKDALISLIERERESEIIDRSLVKGILTIFIDVGMNDMGIYEADFESHLLKATHLYYERKAALWVQEDSCPDYLRKAEACLIAEEDRADGYLHSSSKKKLLEAVQAELLQKCAQQLLEKESGCSAMLQDNKVEDLSRLCRVFSRVPDGLNPIADIFRKHIEDEGMALVAEVTGAADASSAGGSKPGENAAARREAANAEQTFIRRILELQDKYLDVVNECFNSHSLLHKALKEAFETFCNKSVAGTSTAELMANFCDILLKKGGSEKLSDEELDKTLEKVVKLLAYISDKDLFSEFYRKKLARRLLSISNSDEHETTFLQRLKQQCGAQFTAKMEGMVNDLRVARSKQHDFEGWLKAREDRKIPLELDVKVLTTGFWPSYKAIELALPSEMVACVEAFQAFYNDTTKHRKLTWIHSLGNIGLKARFNKQTKDLILQPYQAALLMLFNDAEELTYTEMKERLNLPEEDMTRILASFCLSKYHILKRINPSKPKAISTEDVFRVNVDFTDKMVRLKIPMPHAEDKRKVVEDVQKDRRHAIDAAIVRIMKSRKVLEHQNLVLEVMQQLSRMFKADHKTIKKRLEDLINRDYIERDKDNAQLFKYIA